MRKTLVTNARVTTSRQVFSGSVLIEGERIAALYTEGQALPPCGAAIDAGGCFLLPGGVDAHTHFDLDCGTTRASDDFYTGSVAAACGGTTTVIDHMAFGPPGCGLGHQSKIYRGLAAPAVVDYGFHGVIQHVDAGVLADMERLRDEEGLQSFKIYLTYGAKLDDGAVLAVLRRAKELNVVICAHCENDAIVTELRRRFIAEGHLQPRWHALSRPAQAEAEAVWRCAMLASCAGDAPLYVVHLSAALGLSALRLARAKGQKNLWAESCPQYLFLDEALYNNGAEGLKYIMSPPLRTAADRDALWAGLADGGVDTLATDHCPFFFATQKQAGAKDFTLCPNGAPGVELRLPLLLSEGFLRGRLTLPEVVRLCCAAPARIFGLAPQKGDIAPGADADLLLFSPSGSRRVTKAMLHENTDYSPYEGMQLLGQIKWTMLRGEIIAQNGDFIGKAGGGRYLSRHTPDFGRMA